MTTSEFNFGLLIDAEELVPHLGNPQLKIVDLSRTSVYEQLHIPHAIHLKPAQLVQQDELTTGLLPDAEKLQQLINALQLSPEHHVVVYDDEGGAWAGRLIWNLHCLGFYRTSLLNGGIHAWIGAGYPTSSEPSHNVATTTLLPVDTTHADAVRVQYAQLRSEVAQGIVQLWDCRTFDEYTGLRLAARRGGHIPHALHYEWSTALNRQNHLKLHTFEHIRQRLQQIGFDLTQPVVVYCQSHHRSGLAYVLGRLLNWQIRAYDGAWSEWGNDPDSPIVTGENPF
ncbi:sulfurtransferase [Acinetobacter sp. MD2(2019)]|uniref:sulfurtransferase n=1 Tax=Acinetobacter sp. MD2(2019) TaxID=2605273 RepID=UPI002D1EB0AC|nr:sulfurtransferase [Acinetobacter sp. MD2(2019)]MEB3754913.1 sulfurtransferase [Acinetobacter sp. MD2(2019)]